MVTATKYLYRIDFVIRWKIVDTNQTRWQLWITLFGEHLILFENWLTRPVGWSACCEHCEGIIDRNALCLNLLSGSPQVLESLALRVRGSTLDQVRCWPCNAIDLSYHSRLMLLLCCKWCVACSKCEATQGGLKLSSSDKNCFFFPLWGALVWYLNERPPGSEWVSMNVMMMSWEWELVLIMFSGHRDSSFQLVRWLSSLSG